MSNPPVLKLGGHGPVRNVPPLVPVRPNLDILAQLVDMGFSTTRASEALIQTQNSLSAALDWLERNPADMDQMDVDIPIEILNESFLESQLMDQSHIMAEDFLHVRQPVVPASNIPARSAPRSNPDPLSIATLNASSSPVTEIHSRYDLNSKDSYRERKRLKEIEAAKAEKAAKEEAKARIKAELERERQERFGTTSSNHNTEENQSKHPEESFEERQRRKEAELEKKKKAEEAAIRERVKREIEEDRKKQGIVAESGETHLSAKEQKERFLQKQKEKEKEKWRLEQEANAKRLQELRQQIKADHEHKDHTHQPTSSDHNEGKKSATELMAEARRARLGITVMVGTQAQAPATSTDTVPSPPKRNNRNSHDDLSDEDEDDENLTIDQIKERNKTRTQGYRLGSDPAANTTGPITQPPTEVVTQSNTMEDIREIQKKRFEEQRKKEKEEEERRLRAERAERLVANSKALKQQANTVSLPSTSSSTHHAHPDPHTERSTDKTIISLRLPDGRIKKSEFSSSDTIADVHKYAASWMPLDSIFSLLIPVPRREFDASSMEISLKDTGLCPRGTLTVLPLQARGIVTQAPPRPAHFERMMGMMGYTGSELEAAEEFHNLSYEELLELQERMGFVPKGLSNKEILTLPTGKYSREEGDDEAFCVICQLDIEVDEMVTTLPKCNHVFHKDHLEQWLKDNRTCPACRQRVVTLPAPMEKNMEP